MENHALDTETLDTLLNLVCLWMTSLDKFGLWEGPSFDNMLECGNMILWGEEEVLYIL
jgi:hypothetical protein